MAWRELRHGWRHFSVFIACLMLGVTVIGSVNGFGAIVEHALNDKASSLLGGDVNIELRGVEASAEQRAFLSEYGQLSHIATLRTMLYRGDDSVLVEVKAVDEAYPLIGSLQLHEPISREDALADGGIIVDPILLSQLDARLGERVTIGNATYTIRATLKREPDRTVQVVSFGPRVMMHYEALQDSGLIQPFSLIEHQYRILADQPPAEEKRFKTTLEEALQARFPDQSWDVDTRQDSNRLVQRFSNQLLSFLTLSGLATFLIAGIGIGSSARAYLEKKLPTMAMFKVLGASRRTVLMTYLLLIGLLCAAGGLAGVALAAAITQLAVPLLAPVLPVLQTGAEFHFLPILLALWYGLLIAYLFSLPALLNAMDVRPSLLFRSKSGMLSLHLRALDRAVLAGLAGLLVGTLLMTARDTGFMLGAIIVLLLAFAAFGGCTWLVRRVTRRLKAHTPWLKLALSNLHRPGSTTGTVIFAIGISLTVLIALTLTEANLQARIKRIVEEEAPSLFLVDIQPHQRAGLTDLLAEYAPAEQINLRPMLRGRITHLNGTPAQEAPVKDDIRWALRGDRGVSTSPVPPDNTELAAGQWWDADYDGPPLVSVDARFMDGFHLELGDTLTVNILGESITAEVASARTIDYTTFQINFSLMLSPGALEGFPRTFLGTIRLDDASGKEGALVRQISQRFPGVTIVRTNEVLSIVRDAIGTIATALRVTVVISLLAGLLVLISALSATLEQRLYDTAVLKVLGARRRDILKSCTAEWMMLAGLTAVLAAGIGLFGAWLIALRFRADTFYLMPGVILATIALCTALVWITGYVGNRRLFRLRPASLLRNE